MDDIDHFLQTLQVRLLPHLEQVSASGTVPAEVPPVVEGILEDWARFAHGRKLRPPMLRERTFWFALFQLEELACLRGESPLYPVQNMLQGNLITITALLKEGRDLPEGYFATRPGEDPASLEADALLSGSL